MLLLMKSIHGRNMGAHSRPEQAKKFDVREKRGK
jgi:hypothetical protein